MNRAEIFTPIDPVRFMIDELGEIGDKTLLEPAAGDGVFI